MPLEHFSLFSYPYNCLISEHAYWNEDLKTQNNACEWKDELKTRSTEAKVMLWSRPRHRGVTHTRIHVHVPFVHDGHPATSTIASYPGAKEERTVHTVCTCTNQWEFLGIPRICILFVHDCVLWRHISCSDVMAAVVVDFDYTVTHALQGLGCSKLTPKPERRESVKYVYEGKDLFAWLRNKFGKLLCSEMILLAPRPGRSNGSSLKSI